MQKCDKCNTKFKFKDGLKSYLNHRIQCRGCGTIYIKDEMTKYRALYNAVLISIGVFLYTSIVSKITISSLIIYFLIISTPWVLYDIIPHKLHKYKLKDEHC